MAVLLGAVAAVLLAWLGFVAILFALRPRDMTLSDAKRLVPDIARLVKALATDRSLPRSVRWRLFALVVYLASPVDLIPDFVPVVGYVDDVVVIALVLRSVVRRAGPDAVERHWLGTPSGLALVRRLSGL